MSSYNYKVKKKGKTNIPVWVWCVGALGLFYVLIENKIVEASVFEDFWEGSENDDNVETYGRGGTILHLLKSRPELNFIAELPVASSTGVVFTCGLQDLKSLLLVVLAFGVDTGLKYAKEKISKRKK